MTLAFEVTGARPDRMALTPVLDVGLRITVTPDDTVHSDDTGHTDDTGHSDDIVQSILLHTQIRVEPERRQYASDEQTLLHDLFGSPERWTQTLKPFLLKQVTLPVRGFTGASDVTLPVDLSYDLEVTAGKFLRALRGGEIPLLFLFSGTVFLRTASGSRVQQIPWELEARYRLPVETYEALMEMHFPGTGWLCLHHDTIDALQQVKTRFALATWDDAVAHLITMQETVP